MSLEINGYLLKDGLKTENAGMCRWGFGEKDGQSYFVKEFLSPKYPVNEELLGPEMTQRMKEVACNYYKERSAFYNKLRECRTGNIVVVEEFFRHGAKYYAVTDRIVGNLLEIEDIARRNAEKKRVLTLSLLYSMATLHKAGIVHSDLKPENILIKDTANGFCTAKIIDFDAGFFETDQPTEIEGSQNYFSPEAVRKMNGAAVQVTRKADVFALGLLLHQYWTGKMPSFASNYHYACEALLHDSPLNVSADIPGDIREVIARMLSKNPEDRPTAWSAWNYISGASKTLEIEKPRPAVADTAEADTAEAIKENKPEEKTLTKEAVVDAETAFQKLEYEVSLAPDDVSISAGKKEDPQDSTADEKAAPESNPDDVVAELFAKYLISGMDAAGEDKGR